MWNTLALAHSSTRASKHWCSVGMWWTRGATASSAVGACEQYHSNEISELANQLVERPILSESVSLTDAQIHFGWIGTMRHVVFRRI